jgi:hypothetical protein
VVANKITTIVDFQIENAKSSLSGLRTQIGDAEGLVGKLKAGFGGLGDTVKTALAGPGGLTLAGGAIAAVGGAAFEAVSKFSDLGVEIGKFADATGLSTDEASRWIEIAGDIGIDAGTLEGAIGKMNKTAGNTPDKFDAAGISIGRMKDGTVDANKTLLNTIDRLNGIKDPAKKAALGAQIFGKGWQNVAELIGEGSDQIVKDLKNVDDAKVFDDDKVRKARDFRAAMDNLHDSFEQISIIIGSELAPAFSSTIGQLAQIVDLAEKVGPLLHTAFSIPGASDTAAYSGPANAIQAAKDNYEAMDAAIRDNVIPSIDDLDRAHKNLADGALANVITGMGTDLPTAADKAKERAKMMTDSIELGLNRDKAALDTLKGNINDHKAWTDLELEFDQVKQQGVDAADAVKNHTEDARTKTLEYSSALDGLKQDIINYATEVLKIPDKKVTDIFVAANPQSVQDFENLMTILTRNRNVNVSIQAKGAPGYNDTGTPHFDEGGMVGGPKGAPVPAVVHGGEMVLTPDQQAALGTGGGVNVGEVHIHVQNMPTPNQLVAILAKYSARNGPAALRAIS